MKSDEWTVRCTNEPSHQALQAYWKMCCQIAIRTMGRKLDGGQSALAAPHRESASLDHRTKANAPDRNP